MIKISGNTSVHPIKRLITSSGQCGAFCRTLYTPVMAFCCLFAYLTFKEIIVRPFWMNDPSTIWNMHGNGRRYWILRLAPINPAALSACYNVIGQCIHMLQTDFAFNYSYECNCGSVVKNPSAKGGDTGQSLGGEDSPGDRDGNPLQYPCLENPMDRGDWWATVQGVAKSRTRLSDWAHAHKRLLGTLVSKSLAHMAGTPHQIAWVLRN